MAKKHSLKVFLCHTAEDKPAVRRLYKLLKAEDWIEPWLDEENITPDQDRELEIETEVEMTDAVLICLSKGSVTTDGFIQKDVRTVLDIAYARPDETLHIVALRLEECEYPRGLRAYQYVDYFPRDKRERAYERLLNGLQKHHQALSEQPERARPAASKAKPKAKAVKARESAKVETRPAATSKTAGTASKAESKPATKPASKAASKSALARVTWGGIEFIRVPAGPFIMGSKGGNPLVFSDEFPQHTVEIPYDYWVARLPVTNEQYAEFIGAANHPYFNWQNKKDHPATNMSWNDCLSYAKWKGLQLKDALPKGLVVRLPTEAEWEKAARGTDGREWPWGNEFDRTRCNVYDSGKGGTVPVGTCSPAGDTPSGIAELIGNVWEWTHSLYKEYPYDAHDGRESETAITARVLRGSAFGSDRREARSAARSNNTNPSISRGFRLVVGPPLA